MIAVRYRVICVRTGCIYYTCMQLVVCNIARVRCVTSFFKPFLGCVGLSIITLPKKQIYA